MVVKRGHYTRFAGYGITRTIEVHDQMRVVYLSPADNYHKLTRQPS